jgi:hypothetical protein
MMDSVWSPIGFFVVVFLLGVVGGILVAVWPQKHRTGQHDQQNDQRDPE